MLPLVDLVWAASDSTAHLAAGYFPSGSLMLTHLVAETVTIWVICLLYPFSIYTSPSCLCYSYLYISVGDVLENEYTFASKKKKNLETFCSHKISLNLICLMKKWQLGGVHYEILPKRIKGLVNFPKAAGIIIDFFSPQFRYIFTRATKNKCEHNSEYGFFSRYYVRYTRIPKNIIFSYHICFSIIIGMSR